MGYELHIIRKTNWDDFEEESKISLEEWGTYVKTDIELELTNGYQINIHGVVNSFQNSPGFCNWKGHPAKQKNQQPWFDYGHGCISTKNPDDDTIRKMIKISEALNGKVQGDDGEFYDKDYFIKQQQAQGLKKQWWKFW